MSVVQRCPSCGTTSTTPGECQACHEAMLRYFCTNHTPRVWLDASTCPQCGARFGDPAREASAPAPAIPPRKRAAAPARAPAPTSAPPPPSSPAAPHETRASVRSSASVRSNAARLPPTAEERLEAGPPRVAPWQRLLQAAVNARYVFPRAAPDPDRPPIGRVAGGCLMRLILLVVFLLLMLTGALFLFGQTLL